jgi:nicotinate dehydrogenase subunit B
MSSRERFGLAVSRRAFLAAGGALIVSFSLLPAPRLFAQQAPAAAKPPGSLGNNPLLDAWIRIDADGGVTVFTGKVEFGQGIKTALVQIAAEQLGVQPARINLITADTSRTPDEGFTAGSRSMQDSGTAIMNAAAQVREILLARAAALPSASSSLTTSRGYAHNRNRSSRMRRATRWWASRLRG